MRNPTEIYTVGTWWCRDSSHQFSTRYFAYSNHYLHPSWVLHLKIALNPVRPFEKVLISHTPQIPHKIRNFGRNGKKVDIMNRLAPVIPMVLITARLSVQTWPDTRRQTLPIYSPCRTVHPVSSLQHLWAHQYGHVSALASFKTRGILRVCSLADMLKCVGQNNTTG